MVNVPGTLIESVILEGEYLDNEGAPEAGALQFRASSDLIDAASNVTIKRAYLTVVLDEDGKFSVILPVTNDPQATPASISYEVIERFRHGRIARYSIRLPVGSGTLDIADVPRFNASYGSSSGDSGGGASSTLAGLGDVNVGGQTSGQALIWNSATSKWVPGTVGGGGGGGAVSSVNGQTGTVSLNAASVGADASGSAATAQANAISSAASDATTKANAAKARAAHTGTQLAATISDFNSAVRTNRLDQMAAPTADVPLSTKKLTGVGNPTAAQDAATKTYVDTAVAGAGGGGVNPALKRWYVALGNRHFAPAQVACVGDSLTEGQGASVKTNRFQTRLQTQLRNMYPSNGSSGGAVDPLIPAARAIYSPSSPWVDTDITAKSGTHTPQTFGPYGRRGMKMSNTASVTYTFTGTKAVIHFMGGTGAGGTWKLDSGSATAFVLGGTDNYSMTVQAYSGTSGTHTITIVCNNAGGFYWCGIEVWDGDEAKGIRLYDWSKSGLKASQMQGDAMETAVMAQIAPALVLVEFGGNEIGQGILPSVFGSSLTSLIAEWKAALSGASKPPASYVIVIPPDGGGTPTYPWADYVAAAKAVAAADPNNVTCCDLGQLMPSYAGSANTTYDYQSEFANGGHSEAADIIAAFLAL